LRTSAFKTFGATWWGRAVVRFEIAIDITDRRWAEEALARQARVLADSDDELGQFASRVSKSLQAFFKKLPPD